MAKTVWKRKPNILSKRKLKQELRPALVRTGKEFREYLRKEVLTNQPTGRLYRRRRGAGFTRSHRASRKGERFANDTGATLRSLKDKMTGPLSVSVEFESPVAGHLIRMERDVISEKDEKKAQAIFKKNSDKALKKLL
jgi:hypothetical protein